MISKTSFLLTAPYGAVLFSFLFFMAPHGAVFFVGRLTIFYVIYLTWIMVLRLKYGLVTPQPKETASTSA